MSVLRNLEARIEGLVEGVFSRAFSSQVQPVEIARKLAKEMDSHKTASVSRVYVPNEYTVHLSEKRLSGYTRSLSQELSAYLLEHARRQDYALLTRPEVSIEVDERLRLGGVRDPAAAGQAAGPPGRERRAGPARPHLMVLQRRPEKTKEPRGGRAAAPRPQTRAIVSLHDRRYVLDGPTAVLGRSRECDCVFDDQNVSRRHAELRRNNSGDWQIVDLGSTNGVKVNGRRVDTSRLAPGDDVNLGTVSFTFDIQA